MSDSAQPAPEQERRKDFETRALVDQMMAAAEVERQASQRPSQLATTAPSSGRHAKRARVSVPNCVRRPH